MSHDIDLVIDTGGSEPAVVWDPGLSVTYNLTPMFMEAGLGSPRDLNGQIASETLPLLRTVRDRLEDEPDRFRALNSPNGWGVYEDAVAVIDSLVTGAQAHPKATWRVM